MLRLVTELTLLIIGIWTVGQLWDIPKEVMEIWKEVK